MAVLPHLSEFACLPGDNDLRLASDKRRGARASGLAAARACIEQEGQVDVEVESAFSHGVTCTLSITSAEWQERRFLLFASRFWEGGSLTGLMDAFEVTGGKAVPLFLSGDESSRRVSVCDGGPADVLRGWSTMPTSLQRFLCAGH
jgi:hypothetical protein